MQFFEIYKGVRKIYHGIRNLVERLHCHIALKGNNASHSSFSSTGIRYICVAIGGARILGKNFSVHNGRRGNPITHSKPCTSFTGGRTTLTVGDNLRGSQTATPCHIELQIGNNVKIGGGSCIYDTDFDALNLGLETNPSTNFKNKIGRLIAGNNVFIGTAINILKRVAIGDNSIVGKTSIANKDIPANEFWTTREARFIIAYQSEGR
jgi:Serine acetyltransferase